MRLVPVAVAALLLAVAPARAQTAPPPQKRVVMRYRTLEKMLRRFSQQAGLVAARRSRTRG